MRTHLSALWFLLALGVAVPAAGQAAGGGRPPAAVELLVGYASFVDDVNIDHGVLGAGARLYLTPRLALGPEFVYMRGPGADRDVVVTGNLTFDVRAPQNGRPSRVTPFLVVGGGLFRHSDRFGGRDFSHVEGAFTGGGGLRAYVGERVYTFGEVRLGWEAHVRVTGGVGFTLAP